MIFDEVEDVPMREIVRCTVCPNLEHHPKWTGGLRSMCRECREHKEELARRPNGEFNLETG